MIAESYDLVTASPTKRIYEAVQKIPKGTVATYGQIAELAGDKKMARAVGELSGAFAFGGADEQAKRLEADGIEVINGRVDLGKYRWKN